LSAKGTETLSAKIVEGIKTLGDKETPSVENLGDIIMQTSDSLDLNNDGTCFDSIAENTFTPEDISTTPYTLYLNNGTVELEQQVDDLEASN